MNDLLFTEKYRPKILADTCISARCKETIKKSMSNPLTITSLIFYSNSPGTGKTTVARAISKELGCDMLAINSSDERGIDTIRDRVNQFAHSLSTDEKIKRLVFLDEADGLTKQAQDSLRNLMESCADNCFFILSCNDLSKVIEPIQSRCICLNFECPESSDICDYLSIIIQNEKIKISPENQAKIVEIYYPDIRRMVMKIQEYSVNPKCIEDITADYSEAMKLIRTKDIKKIYEFVYSKTVDLGELNRFLFRQLFENYDKYDPITLSIISERLADTEKYFYLGVHKETVFLNNILQIMGDI